MRCRTPVRGELSAPALPFEVADLQVEHIQRTLDAVPVRVADLLQHTVVLDVLHFPTVAAPFLIENFRV